MTATIHLVRGADEVGLADALADLLGDLVGDRSRNEVLEEFRGDTDLGEALLAANSVSMFGDRVVVVREAARFGVGELGPLLDYLSDPSPSTSLVVVWEKPVATAGTAHPLPKKLIEAVRAADGVIHDTAPPTQARARQAWLVDRLAAAPVKVDAKAGALIAERFGEDVQRVNALVDLLASSFPPGTRLGVDQVEPLLGGAGGAPPWELTDAIDRGDVGTAIDRLHRMMRAGDRHPLQVMAVLHNHFERMMRLDGLDVVGEADAAAVLGLKGSTFPAKKALESARRLGGERIARAVQLLAGADVDLRGATGEPPEAVMEVLVGRLARLGSR